MAEKGTFEYFCENECEDRFASEAPFNCLCPYSEEIYGSDDDDDYDPNESNHDWEDEDY